LVNKTKNIIDIITKAKKGDDTSFTLLLNMFWKDVYRFLFSKTSDENEAEDLTIRTFAKAFEKIDSFDESYEFKTWLISISSNLYIDQFRKRKTKTISLHKESSEAYRVKDEEPTPDDKLIIEQNLAQLLAYIKQLKPHYQEIINLRFFQEMSYKEMAKELDEPMSNIKVKLLRAKKLLAEIINRSDS
jgi:RNA polymerase sigma-70 factor (ECF subfamily)